ncbi:MAG: class I SAM-dependent methyltransferase [Solirubrobacteraceae bacterium]
MADAAQGTRHNHPVFARFWSVVGARAVPDADREELLAGLAGPVLEIGAGDGLNFAHYPGAVTSLLAVEPEPHLRARAETRAAAVPLAVTVTDGTAERLPAPDASVDAVVTCLVLCSVDDQATALSEIARVLRPGGELRFYEHVVAHARAGAALQRGLDRSGVWPRIGAGCHLARDTESAMAAAGFTIERSRRFKAGPAVPHVTGVSRIAGA